MLSKAQLFGSHPFAMFSGDSVYLHTHTHTHTACCVVVGSTDVTYIDQATIFTLHRIQTGFSVVVNPACLDLLRLTLASAIVSL